MLSAMRRPDPSFVAAGLGLIVTVASLLYFARAGFGTWDETFYIQSLMDPKAYDALLTPFGLLLHPLYLLSGKSLIALRIGGIMLLASSGAVLGHAVERYYRTVNDSPRLDHLALFGALAGMLYYVLWILTPSYNLLVNAAGALILAGGIGWVTRMRDSAAAKDIPSICVGLGGAMAFLSKPTFAALAALLVLAELVVLLRYDRMAAIRGALVAGATSALVVVGTISLNMPLGGFVERVETGTRVFAIEYGLGGLIHRTVSELAHAPIPFLVTLGMCLFAVLATPWLPGERSRALLVRLLLALAAVNLALLIRKVAIGMIGAQDRWSTSVAIAGAQDPWSTSIGAPVIALAVAQIAAGLARRPDRLSSPATILPIACLLLAPFMTSFGSANNLLMQTGMSLYAVVLAAILGARLCFSPHHARLIEAGWIAIVLALLAWSAMRPYNLPAPIVAQTHPVSLPFTRDVLLVDKPTAVYVERLQAVAERAGITSATHIVDLSGAAPATVAVLGGRAPFYPWLMPFVNDPGRAAAAAWSSMTPIERRRAWLVGPVDARMAAHPVIA